MFVIDDALPADHVDEVLGIYRAQADKRRATPQKYIGAMRVRHDVSFPQHILDRLEMVVPPGATFTPLVHIYKAGPGCGEVYAHKDSSERFMNGAKPPESIKSTHTILLYLTGCEGGRTWVQHQNGVKEHFTPKPGRILVFSHDTYHGADDVTGGTKIVGVMRANLPTCLSVQTHAEHGGHIG